MLLFLTMLVDAQAAEVRLPWALYEALLPPDDEPEPKPPGPMLHRRDLVIRQADPGSVHVQASWRVGAEQPGWVELALPDPSFWVDVVRWNGRPAAVRGMRDGSRRILVWVDGPGRLEVDGEVPGELRRGVRLQLPGAAIGRVEVITDDPDIEVTGGDVLAAQRDGVFWTSAEAVTVSTEKAVETRAEGALVVAHSGLGLTVGDAAIEVQGRLRYEIRRGTVAQVRFQVPGAGSDLDVTSEGISGWRRQGDVVVVDLAPGTQGAVELEVRWSATLPDRDEVRRPLPTLVPLDVFRSRFGMQLARDGDRDIVPELGWTAVAQRELPEVARGLVRGTPVSSWTDTSNAGGGPDAGSLGLYRFAPASGPPTIVDVAAWEGAYSLDGRLLLRGHLAVRNDRGAFLDVSPPPGATLVSARVDGVPAQVAQRDGRLLLPLAKSVETVEGLLSFPITLVFLCEGESFERRDERSLLLPTIDAEVAATRVTLHLPPSAENRLDEGEGSTVASFSEGQGLTYGFATGDARAAQADQLYRDALGAWMSNSFDEAQDKLDALRGVGGDNENVRRLQSNLDVVLKDEGGGGDVAMANRVKEQARARSQNMEQAQLELITEAEKAYAAGDYDEAERAYQSAVEVGQVLEKLETGGSVESRSKNASLSKRLDETRVVKDKKKKAAKTAAEPEKAPRSSVLDGFSSGVVFGGKKADMPPAPPPPPPPPVAAAEPPEEVEEEDYDDRTVIDFDDFEVSGELVKPEGALLLPKPVTLTASTYDVVIPAYGQTVRYQKLLTRAGQRIALPVRTKTRRVR